MHVPGTAKRLHLTNKLVTVKFSLGATFCPHSHAQAQKWVETIKRAIYLFNLHSVTNNGHCKVGLCP